MYIPGPPKEPKIMAQYLKTESIGSIGSIILEVQVLGSPRNVSCQEKGSCELCGPETQPMSSILGSLKKGGHRNLTGSWNRGQSL